MAVDLGMLATYVSAFNTKYAKNFKNAVLKEEQFKEQIIEIFKEIDKGLSFLYGQKATDQQFFDAFYREAKARVTFSFEESTTLQDDDEYRPWVSKLWREIEGSAQFWQAYSSRLRFDKHWSDETVEEINKVADDVLDHCGNPRETSYFSLVTRLAMPNSTSRCLRICRVFRFLKVPPALRLWSLRIFRYSNNISAEVLLGVKTVKAGKSSR